MLRRRNLFSAVLFIGSIIVSFGLAIHYFLIIKDENLMPTIRIMDHEEPRSLYDAAENKFKLYHEETRPLSYVENTFKLYDKVETLVLFIGYPHSCNSLVGAILDAHPEVIIAHEYNLMYKWNRISTGKLKAKHFQRYYVFHELYQTSQRQAVFGIRANIPLVTTPFSQVVCNYHVPGSWQGGFRNKIKVIGDKLEGPSTNNTTRIGQIGSRIQVPMKFIHVTRNPFDNIASMMLNATCTLEAVRHKGAKIENTQDLESAIEKYFKMAAANQRVRERFGDAVIDIPGHETALRPRETIQKLCDHLRVTCSDEYLDKCSKIMYGSPSVTRDKVVWTDEQKKRVTESMKNYPFLKHYSFADDYPK